MEVIVLGNDHTNTLGVVQSLGLKKFKVSAYVWGVKTGMVKASKFLSHFHSCDSVQSCMDAIIAKGASIVGNQQVPIIPCCDTAALAIDQHKNMLPQCYVYGTPMAQYNIEQLQNKDIQCSIAQSSGLNVPLSASVNNCTQDEINFIGPYLIKPIISIKGSKSDIKVCENIRDLEIELNRYFNHYKMPDAKVLIQQYIPHDYEISLLGLVTSCGDVFMPAIEYKTTQYPLNVGLECNAIIEPFEENELKKVLTRFVKKTGYRGLFSIEMMHSSIDDKFYFTEFNLRNDGANSFIRQAGVNLPYIYCQDLLGDEYQKGHIHPGKYIWEQHHFSSAKAKVITWRQWLKELKEADGYLLYVKEDKKPFFRQLYLLVKSKLRIKQQYYS